MNKFSRTATAAVLALSVLKVPPGIADDTPDSAPDSWYQIHIAIFGHRSETGEHEEVWRNKLQLKYPQNLFRLKTRERYLADLCGLNAPETSRQTAAGNNRLLDILERVDSGEGYREEDFPASSQAAEPPVLDPRCKEVRADLFPPDKEDIANTEAAAVVASAESLLSDDGASPGKKNPAAAQRTSYVLEKQINDEEFAALVKKLSGAYRYRLLFSGSWPQSLQSREQATALLIEGGDAIGQHHELEGYIRVGLERYLHIDTDLWLSKFSSQRQNRLYANKAVGNDFNSAHQSPEEAPQRISEFPALPTPFPLNDRQATRSGPEVDARADNDSYRPSSNLDVLAAEDSSYLVEQTVVMRQNRRMRSSEVHYLDHPMFGVLIKITPITASTQK
ncbi:MAG: hypothetical protein ACI89D_002579 [Bermanella sp.]|jgi:hypothetical protein